MKVMNGKILLNYLLIVMTIVVLIQSLSSDEKTLYFSSDMPGTLGASDLFKVSVQGDSFGTPENLVEK